MQFYFCHVVEYLLASPRVRCIVRWRVRHRFRNADALHVILGLATAVTCMNYDFLRRARMLRGFEVVLLIGFI